MSEIEIDIEAFENLSKLFSSSASECKKSENKVKATTKDLLSTWKGDSKKAFEKEFNDLTKDMYNYEELLKIISKDLKNIAESFKEVDEKIRKELIN